MDPSECACQIHRINCLASRKGFREEKKRKRKERERKKLGYEAHSKIFRRVITFLQWQRLPVCLNTTMVTEPEMAKIDNSNPLLLQEGYSLDQHRRWGLLRLYFLICSWTLEWGNGDSSLLWPLPTPLPAGHKSRTRSRFPSHSLCNASARVTHPARQKHLNEIYFKLKFTTCFPHMIR